MKIFPDLFVKLSRQKKYTRHFPRIEGGGIQKEKKVLHNGRGSIVHAGSAFCLQFSSPPPPLLKWCENDSFLLPCLLGVLSANQANIFTRKEYTKFKCVEHLNYKNHWFSLFVSSGSDMLLLKVEPRLRRLSFMARRSLRNLQR